MWPYQLNIFAFLVHDLCVFLCITIWDVVTNKFYVMLCNHFESLLFFFAFAKNLLLHMYVNNDSFHDFSDFYTVNMFSDYQMYWTACTSYNCSQYIMSHELFQFYFHGSNLLSFQTQMDKNWKSLLHEHSLLSDMLYAKLLLHELSVMCLCKPFFL